MRSLVWCSVVAVATLAATTTAGTMREKRQARRCPGGEECKLLSRCGTLQDIVNEGRPDVERIIRRAQCTNDPIPHLRVCCPDTVSSSPVVTTRPQPGVNGEDLLPKGFNCGQSKNVRVVFGKEAPLLAYPWMALLGFDSINSPKWSCGGVLINDRYVLTAAHCVHADFMSQAGVRSLEVVRLGEHNTATVRDCSNTDANNCAPPPQDFTPEQIIMHETFHKRAPVSDDIALIRLNKKYSRSNGIAPVCLPAAGLDVESFVGNRDAIVAGWGRTETAISSDTLMAAKIPFVNKTLCEPHYPGQLVPEQVCFGGRGRADSCFGDSGGPVFQTTPQLPQFTVLGIVSRGLPQCGTPGAPAVYTNVAFYRKWITDNIRP